MPSSRLVSRPASCRTVHASYAAQSVVRKCVEQARFMLDEYGQAAMPAA